MKMNFPTSIVATFDSLTYAAKRLEEANPQPRIDGILRKDLLQANAALHQAKDNFNQALQDKRLAAQARDRAGQALIFLVRDFYLNLKRASRRDESAQAWVRHYPPASEIPTKARLSKQWYGLAKRVVDAHAKSTSLTFLAPPPTNPTAEEIVASYQVAEAAELAYRDACQTLKTHAAALNKAAKLGARQLRWLMVQLRRLAVDETPAGRRELLRSYGMSFESEEQEDTCSDPPDEGPEGAVA